MSSAGSLQYHSVLNPAILFCIYIFCARFQKLSNHSDDSAWRIGVWRESAINQIRQVQERIAYHSLYIMLGAGVRNCNVCGRLGRIPYNARDQPPNAAFVRVLHGRSTARHDDDHTGHCGSDLLLLFTARHTYHRGRTRVHRGSQLTQRSATSELHYIAPSLSVHWLDLRDDAFTRAQTDRSIAATSQSAHAVGRTQF